MNRYVYFAIGTVLSAVGFISVAHGQMTEPVRFHAPVAFQAGGATMPAGEYTVRNLTESADEGVLIIEPEHGRACFVNVQRVDTPDHIPAASTMVKLQKEGDSMHLTNIWLGGERSGFRILEGHAAPANTASGN